jgi:phosphohistidine phosphatase
VSDQRLTRTLYLLRHAKSSWDEPALPDRERPLAPRGRKDGKRIADHLRASGIEPELALCSPAERTRQTLELIGVGSTVRFEEELYAASSDALLELVRAVPDPVASVMLIGHNPGLQELALALASTGDELGRLAAKFPTAALATLTLGTTWASLEAGEALLVDYVVPKQLRVSGG